VAARSPPACRQVRSLMLGQTELVHRAHLCGNDAKHEIDPEPLADNAGAIPAECVLVGKIGVAPLVQMRFVQAGKKTFCERERLLGSETRGVSPNRLQRSVQPPERRRVYAKMNIRRAGTLSGGQVFIDMRQRMRAWRACRRCWRHNAPRFLCSATVRVNSKAFRPGTPAPRIAPEFLFDKVHDHGFEQACGDPQRSQYKSSL